MKFTHDDACSLRRYIFCDTRGEADELLQYLRGCDYRVDRFHFRGHVDKYCLEFCSPLTDELRALKINDSICESTVAWWHKHGSVMRQLNKWKYLWYSVTIFDLHNQLLKAGHTPEWVSTSGKRIGGLVPRGTDGVAEDELECTPVSESSWM